MIKLRNSKTTYLGKVSKRSRYALDCHIGAVQMKEDRVWHDIDPTLENGLPRRVPYIVTPYLTGMPGFHYKSKQSGEFDIRLKSAKSLSLSGSPTLVAKIPVPIIDGKRIIWRDVYPDTDVVLLHRNTGVTLQRIIKSTKSPLEYDVDIDTLEEGIAQVVPIRPATDAIGQPLLMEETKILDGRTELLKMEVIGEPQPIVYPIKDATTVEEQVDASADDAYSSSTSDINGFDTSTVIATTYTRTGAHFSSPNQIYWAVGYRFSSVIIPAGASDFVAYLIFKSRSNRSETTINTNIEGLDTLSPAVFATNENLGSRDRTTAVIAWDNIGTWVANTSYNSLSIVSIIDELYASYDYSGGSAMGFLWYNDGSSTGGSYRERQAWTWDYDDNLQGAKLHIEYTAGGGWAGEYCGVAVDEFGGVTPAEIDGV